MSGEAKNIYISHAYCDDALRHVLGELLKDKGYAVQDSLDDSANIDGATDESPFDETVLAPRIDCASVLLVLIAPGTCSSPRVEWEIEYAERRGKRIVGVYVQGGQDSDLPASFQKYGGALVSFQAGRVMDALNGAVDTWFKPDGSTLFPERDIERFTCGEPEPE